MVSAFQVTLTRTTAGTRLRVPARPLDRVVATQAGRAHLLLTLGMGQSADLN